MNVEISLQCKHQSNIPGVVIRPLTWHGDHRGFTAELFRHDEQPHHNQAMGYMSYTLPGVSRGPHEHEKQTDYFVFLGPGIVRLTLWDNKNLYHKIGGKLSHDDVNAILATKESFDLIDHMVIIPPMIIHGYRNLSSDEQAMILNFPNKLYKGWGREEPVDEIRHENEPNSPFKLD